MNKINSSLSLIFLILMFACTDKSAPVEKAEQIDLEISSHLRGKTDVEQISSRLKSFLQSKNAAAWENDYWMASDFGEYTYPFVDLYKIEREGFKYIVELLELIDTHEANSKVVKIAYSEIDQQENVSLKFIYNLLAVERKGLWYFKRILKHNSRDWETFELDGFTYIVSPERAFNKEEALAQMAFKDSLVDFFGVGIPPITYYSCVNPEELFQLKGYDYVMNMYMAETGGLSEVFSSTLFSGSNSDRYDHELVHFFTHELYPKQMQPLLHEGIATYLGGSGGMVYQALKESLANYLADQASLKLKELIKPYQRNYLMEDSIDASYVVGAVVCDYVMKNFGKATLLDLLATPADEDIWLAFEKVGLTQENFSKKLNGVIGE